MKTAPSGSEEEDSLKAEFAAYRAAADIQGSTVPQVLAFGKAFGGRLTVLATQLIKGAQIKSPCSREVMELALQQTLLELQTHSSL